MRGSLIGANRPGSRARTRDRRPRIERLEDRRLLATFTVTNTLDSGSGSLRDAITQANTNAGADVIEFNIGGSGVQTINLASALPTIIDPVTIDGTTQPGFAGVPRVELNGTNAGAATHGLRISAANSVVKGLIINRFGGDGIRVDANFVTIQQNFIGTNNTGGGASANGGAGIFVDNATRVLIGGAGLGNLISGNTGPGLVLNGSASSNQVLANFIGTAAGATGPLPNLGGILISGGNSNAIGSDQANTANVISGNAEYGVRIAGTNARSNTLLGNFIGTNLAGNAPIGNGPVGVDLQNAPFNVIGAPNLGNVISAHDEFGIRLDTAGATLIQGNRIGTNPGGTIDLGNGSGGIRVVNSSGTVIGGTVAGAGNVIAFNGRVNPGAGVTIVSGNSIPILSNSIYSNGQLGIDLGDDGVTPNDPGDFDTGPNGLQNFPVLTSAATAAGRTLVQGTLSSGPNRTYLVQFFSQSQLDPTGFGQGRTLIGSALVTTDANGNAVINSLLDAPTVVGDFITATATTEPSATGETSEFSAGIAVVAARIADLAVTIQDTPDPAVLGGTLVYTVTVTNRGPDPATGVQFSQVLPSTVTFNSVTTTQGTVAQGGPGLTGNLGTIASGASVTITVTVTPNATGQILTSASVFSPEIDTDTANNDASETTTVDIPADVQVTLSTDPVPGVVGERLDFVALITNNGPGTATNVRLTADLPAGVTYIGAFSSQGSSQLVGNTVVVDLGSVYLASTTAVRIAVIPDGAGPLSLTARVTTDVLDPNGANDQATATANVLPSADLGVTIDSSQDFVLTGANATYTIRATNNGPQTATNVVLTSRLGPGLAFVSATATDGGGVSSGPNGSILTTFPVILPGQTVTLTLLATPAGGVSLASGVDARVESADSADLVPGNDSAAFTTFVNPADLAVVQTAAPNPASSNQELTYNLVVRNNGPAGATNVRVTDVLPAGATLVRIDTPGNVTLSPDGTRFVVTFPTLAPGASVPIALVVRPGAAGTVTNAASVTSDQLDRVADDNASSLTVFVDPADLAVSLRASAATVLAGDELTYTAVIRNRGPVAITTGATFINELPAGLVVRSVSTTRGTATNFDGTIVAELGPLGAGEQAVVTIVVTPTVVGTITNTARAASPQPDNDATNNTASAVVNVTNAPGQISLAQPTFVVREDAGRAVITLIRNRGTQGTVAVRYAVVEGTARAGVNFEPVSDVVVFGPGETSKTFTIPILHDGQTTGPLTATIALSDATGGATIGAQSAATLVIADVDVDLTPPVVTDVSLFGPASGISGVVLAFSEPLNPDQAANAANYFVFQPNGRPVPFEAVYDPATARVFLLFAAPIRSGPSFSTILINGDGLSDVSGNALDGDLNGAAGGVYLASFARGNRLNYRDADGDRVSLSLANGGYLDMVRGADGASRVLRVNGAPNGRSVLSGAVSRNRLGGNGLANLGRIEGVAFGQVRSRLTTPPFVVESQIPPVVTQAQGRPAPRGALARQLAARRPLLS